jgi:serine/threonine protein kinase
LGDFGISKLELIAITREVGTPLYHAPEILSGSRHTYKGEVYSLGITAVVADTKEFRAKIGTQESVRRVVEDSLLL